MELASDPFKCLANPIRRSVLAALRQQPMSVEQLLTIAQEWKAISQSTLSEHLAVLRQAGMVSVQARATERIYSLRREGFTEVFDWVKEYEAFWDQKLDNLAKYLDKEHGVEDH